MKLWFALGAAAAAIGVGVAAALILKKKEEVEDCICYDDEEWDNEPCNETECCQCDFCSDEDVAFGTFGTSEEETAIEEVEETAEEEAVEEAVEETTEKSEEETEAEA